MSNYAETKKVMDKIRDKYGCKGEVLFRTAIQSVVEYGQYMFQDEEFIADQMRQIDDRHDAAEAEGKTLWITRAFEKAIIECCQELAEVNSYDLLMYIQREVWLGNDGISLDRAKQIAEKVMDWITIDSSDSSEDYDTFSNYCGIDDDELEGLGFGYLIPTHEEED